MSQQTISKLQQLYKTGQYQCDHWFYENLIQLAKEMEMHEYIHGLEHNFTHVKRIHKLIEENSDSLNEDFDQQQAALKSVEIKKQIHHLTPQHVSSTMLHLHKQRFTSYTQHALNLIQKYQYHPKYEAIFESIVDSVYDPIMRVENVLVCVLFMLRNTQKIEEILAVYEKGIEGGLGVMKAFRARANKVKELIVIVGKKLAEISKQSKKEQELTNEDRRNVMKMKTILNHLQNYCYGIYLIYTTTLKLCDLVKIFQGKKNFLLKINSYKADVEEIIDIWDNSNLISQKNKLSETKAKLRKIQKQMGYMPTKELKFMFIGDKSGIEKINRTCKICLRYIEKEEKDQPATADYHKICQVTMKALLGESQARQK